MPVTHSFQSDPASVSSEEEPRSGIQIVSKIQRVQELMQKKQQQEREEAEFKKQLDETDLKELMQMQKQQQEEAARKASILSAVERGEMSALTPYMKGGQRFARIISEDDDIGVVIIAEKHLRNETSCEYVKDGQSPVQALEETKKWLKETFPTQQTDAILVRDYYHPENYLVESLGVSSQEVGAAENVQKDKQRAEERSAEVTARIQEKIKEGPQKTAALQSDQTATALATPGVQRESTGLAPPHRG